MLNQKYELLSKDDGETLDVDGFSYANPQGFTEPPKRHLRHWKVLGCISVCINIALLIALLLLRGRSTDSPTPYGMQCSFHP